MPNDLTFARLRELIAAATPRPWKFSDGMIYQHPGRGLIVDFVAYAPDGELLAELANNAPALADAQDEADLLKWLGKSILNGWTIEWNPHQGMFEVLNDEGRYVAGSDQWIDALRAAKEASRG